MCGERKEKKWKIYKLKIFVGGCRNVLVLELEVGIVVGLLVFRD